MNGTGGRPNRRRHAPSVGRPAARKHGHPDRYRTTARRRIGVFTVSWLAVPYYCAQPQRHDCARNNQNGHDFRAFQVQIYEQGQFVYRYGVVDGSGRNAHDGGNVSNANGASVGYELSNSDFVQFSFQTAAVPNNKAILWQRVSTARRIQRLRHTHGFGSITGVITPRWPAPHSRSRLSHSTPRRPRWRPPSARREGGASDASDNSGRSARAPIAARHGPPSCKRDTHFVTGTAAATTELHCNNRGETFVCGLTTRPRHRHRRRLLD